MCNVKEHENQQNHMRFCTADEKPDPRHFDPGQTRARGFELVNAKSHVILLVLVFLYIAQVLV